MGRGNAAWLKRMFLDGEIVGAVEDTCRLLSLAGKVSPRARVDADPSLTASSDTKRRPRRRSTVVDTIGEDITSRPSAPGSAGEASVGPERGSARPCSAAAADVREAPLGGAGERSERAGGQSGDDGPLGASRRQEQSPKGQNGDRSC